MPGDILNADIRFPHFTGEESTEDKVAQITDYLYMLLEQLRYNFGNIGPENMTESSIWELTKIIEKPLMLQVKDLLTITVDDGQGGTSKIVLDGPMIQTLVQEESEDAATSAITQAASNITLAVTNNAQQQSKLQMTFAGTTITSDVINLSGYVTFSNLSTSGQTTINGGNITTGYMSADRISGGEIDARYIDVTHLDADNITSGTITGRDIKGCNIYAANSSVTYAKMVSTGYETYIAGTKKAFIGVNNLNSYYPAVILYGQNHNAYFELLRNSSNDDVIWIGNGDQTVGLYINLTQGTYTWTGMTP